MIALKLSTILGKVHVNFAELENLNMVIRRYYGSLCKISHCPVLLNK